MERRWLRSLSAVEWRLAGQKRSRVLRVMNCSQADARYTDFDASRPARGHSRVFNLRSLWKHPLKLRTITVSVVSMLRYRTAEDFTFQRIGQTAGKYYPNPLLSRASSRDSNPRTGERAVTDHERMDPNVGRAALKKISWRLLPLLCVGYGIAYMDRVNISFAALQMNDELHFSATVYGLGGGLFFLSYCLLEIPSNLLLVRFGARRWISRIMFTWGILAICMMFVKTPAQFYAMRFMLGAAEAGFFPGVLFYLSNWFPEAHSGRAISRFYVSLPISVAFMGVLAAPLLNLQGMTTLSGWQWLFLVEGIPAVIVSALIWRTLPDNPVQARWLSTEEQQWIVSRVSISGSSVLAADEHRLSAALTSAYVWKFGFCNLLIMGSAYAFNLSAPALLKVATRWDTAAVGLLISGTAIAGAVCMLINGWHSDRHNERYLHTIVPLSLMACSLGVIGSNYTPVLVIPAYVTYYLSSMAVQAAFWPLASNTLRGRLSAVGLAAIGSIGMFGGFLGPVIWGIARDHTGSYRAGLLALGVLYVAVAASLLSLRSETRRSGVVVSLS